MVSLEETGVSNSFQRLSRLIKVVGGGELILFRCKNRFRNEDDFFGGNRRFGSGNSGREQKRKLALVFFWGLIPAVLFLSPQ